MHRLFVPAALLLLLAGPAFADDVGARLDDARAANDHGDALRTLSALQQAETLISNRLADQFSKVLPAPPAGWDATPPDSSPNDNAGGGLTITRGYQKGESSLNVSLVIDNPAVAASAALFMPGNPETAQPNWTRIKVGTEDALMRYDSQMHEGEVLMVIGSRALLEIEGSEIANSGVLSDEAKGWNFATIRRLLGL